MNKTYYFSMMVAFTLVSGSFLLSGCASGLQGDVYTREEARKPQTVRMGTVEALRPVRIEGTKTNIGSASGAAVGGIAGSSIGGGKGQWVGAVIGAVAGGMAGAAIEEGLTRTQGVEITVREDDGQLRAYVQALREGEIFRVGERVRILTIGGTARVSH